MQLKLKNEAEAKPVFDQLENGQLFLDEDGDLCLVVKDNQNDRLRSVCFVGQGALAMRDRPKVLRLVSPDEVEVV